MNKERDSDRLAEFLTDRRKERMDRVLAHRTRAFTIVLENLYDPHNISAILRSAEAFGVQDVYIIETEDHPFRLSHAVTRGCERWLTLHRYNTVAACVEALRGAGYEVAVADHRPDTPRIDNLNFSARRAYWMGAEHAGVSEEARALADTSYLIPMNGFTESLNVSVAAAITLFTARTRWEAAGGQSGDLSETESETVRLQWMKNQLRQADTILERRKNDPSPGSGRTESRPPNRIHDNR